MLVRLLGGELQVFVNCSTSDVVATTSLEALALGKWVVCAEHPCNQFIAGFPTCLIFRSLQDFQRLLRHALTHDPPPLGAEQLRWVADLLPIHYMPHPSPFACVWKASTHATSCADDAPCPHNGHPPDPQCYRSEPYGAPLACLFCNSGMDLKAMTGRPVAMSAYMCMIVKSMLRGFHLQKSKSAPSLRQPRQTSSLEAVVCTQSSAYQSEVVPNSL